MKNTFTSLGIAIAALATAAYSCSSSDTGVSGLGLGQPSTGKGGAGGTLSKAGGSAGLVGNASGGSANDGSGATVADGNRPGISVDGGTETDGSTTIDQDAACGTGKVSAMLKQVDMFVMYDRSWSMNECGDGSTTPIMTTGGMQTLSCDTGPSRWALTSAALTQFFQSPQAAGLNVALRFFPDDKPAVGCDGYQTTGGTMFGGGPMFGGGGMTGAAGTTGMTGGAGGPNCSADACAQPLVDIAPLLADPAPTDAHEAALVAAVMAATPPGPAAPVPNPATPTSAALAGAVQWATMHQAGRTDLQTAIVLITDGEPQGCDTNIDNIAKIASDAYANAGILTYVIGLVGADMTALNVLDKIAVGGGTTQALFVDPGMTATQQLLDELLAIKGMALSCDLDVPTSDEAGMKIDPHLINVNYSSGTGMPTELGYVASMADCGSGLDWYYDDPTTPTKILLCPSTCDTIKADTMASLQILAGCVPHVVTK